MNRVILGLSDFKLSSVLSVLPCSFYQRDVRPVYTELVTDILRRKFRILTTLPVSVLWRPPCLTFTSAKKGSFSHSNEIMP